MTIPTDAGAILDAARRHAGLTVQDLWVRCYGLGGMATHTELAAYLSGEGEPSAVEYDVIAQALNDWHIERGENHPVPYATGLDAR